MGVSSTVQGDILGDSSNINKTYPHPNQVTIWYKYIYHKQIRPSVDEGYHQPIRCEPLCSATLTLGQQHTS